MEDDALGHAIGFVFGSHTQKINAPHALSLLMSPPLTHCVAARVMRWLILTHGLGGIPRTRQPPQHAEMDDTDSLGRHELFVLGLAHLLNGDDCDAQCLLTMAYEQGVMYAQSVDIQHTISHGRISPDQLREVLTLSEDGATRGDVHAMANVSTITCDHMLMNERGLERRMFAADMGNTTALVQLAAVEIWNIAQPHTVERLTRARMTGNIDAMFELGRLIYHDLAAGTRHEAFALFTEAANAGHMNSMWFISRMRHRGDGCEKNHSEAMHWMHKMDNVYLRLCMLE